MDSGDLGSLEIGKMDGIKNVERLRTLRSKRGGRSRKLVQEAVTSMDQRQ